MNTGMLGVAANAAATEAADRIVLVAPMGIEARALRRGAPERDDRAGRLGPAARAAAPPRWLTSPAQALAVAGFGGALSARSGGRRRGRGQRAAVAGRDRRGHVPGRRDHRGHAQPPRPACPRRAEWSRCAAPRSAICGRRCATPERWWPTWSRRGWHPRRAGGRSWSLRAVLDTADRELWSPVATLAGTRRAARSLSVGAEVLLEWAAAIRPRELVLAAPRASCAGVERAIEIGRAGARRVRRAGLHAQADRPQPARGRRARAPRRGLRRRARRGPDGSTVVFSAHGVSPAGPRAGGRARGSTWSTRPARWCPRCTPRRGGSPARLHDRARRPRGPRGGRGHLRRGGGAHPVIADDVDGGRAAARSPIRSGSRT